MKVRAILVSEAKDVCDFWERNYKVSDRDASDRIATFIEKNNGLSTLAQEGDEIIGTVLGSYDGRKGYIYKVVVKDNFRGTGLGQRLVEETVRKIKEAGALDIRVNCAKELVGFYEKCGFKLKGDLYQLQIKNY
jgi:predicted GNAT family N-acyltransferase